MSDARLQRLLMLVLVSLLAAIGVVLVSTRRSGGVSTTPASTKSKFDGPTMPPGLRAGDFSLLDQNDRRVTLSQYRGHVVILTFIHSLCHDACPFMVEQIKGALNDLPNSGRAVPAIGISVAPAEDTRASRLRFLAKHEMRGRLAFVNGSTATMRRVWHAYAIQPVKGPDRPLDVRAADRQARVPAGRLCRRSADARRARSRYSGAGARTRVKFDSSISAKCRHMSGARGSEEYGDHCNTGRICFAAENQLLGFSRLSHHDRTRELVVAIQQLSLARSVGQIQAIVRTSARRLTGADGATFVLRDGDRCYYADEDAISPLWKGQRFPMSVCISGWAMLNRRPAVIEDIYADQRIPHDAYRPTFVKSLAMVPIRTLDPVGAIGNYWATRHQPTEQEVELLQALADSTAVAMENVRVYSELEQRVADRTAELQARTDELEETNRTIRSLYGEASRNFDALRERNDHHLQVLRTLAHEVRTPLAAAQGILRLTLRDSDSFEPQCPHRSRRCRHGCDGGDRRRQPSA